jgi:hypothetical protein
MKKGAEIYIYRNLTRGGFSLRYKGHVISHSDAIWVTCPRFVVSLTGNARVRRERKKYVHAYVAGENGFVEWPFKVGIPAGPWRKVSYNPYTMTEFRLEDTGEGITYASAAILLPRGLYVLEPYKA